MLRSLLRRNTVKRMPFLRVLAFAEVALLARRHLTRLDRADRRRLAELARHGRSLSPAEREELRRLVGKMQPGTFVGSALDSFSPVPLPRRFTGRR